MATKTKKPRFKSKPPVTRHNDFGLPRIVVVPTFIDKHYNFSDTPVKDETEYLDMIQRPSDKRSAVQRLMDSVHPSSNINYDSQEIGVQCFDDTRWPEHTDLCCWWCLHQFNTRPFPCPTFKSCDGTVYIRGVFCGPSCAKAWAITDGKFVNAGRICSLINELAKKRGFLSPDRETLYIPTAPPRETLYTFRGSDGLTIEQFRLLCANGFDVTLLFPPYITEKQVIVAECERMSKMAHQGRTVHMDDVNGLMIPAAEFAKHRRQGLEIFAGIGARRLTDFIGNKVNKSVSLSSNQTNTTVTSNEPRKKRPISPVQSIKPVQKDHTLPNKKQKNRYTVSETPEEK